MLLSIIAVVADIRDMLVILQLLTVVHTVYHCQQSNRAFSSVLVRVSVFSIVSWSTMQVQVVASRVYASQTVVAIVMQTSYFHRLSVKSDV